MNEVYFNSRVLDEAEAEKRLAFADSLKHCLSKVECARLQPKAYDGEDVLCLRLKAPGLNSCAHHQLIGDVADRFMEETGVAIAGDLEGREFGAFYDVGRGNCIFGITAEGPETEA
ncbi:hypothetical protein CMI37_18385 [Candidatus Pacearchaeota archaeon]|nr:hypothetical protein [Candidatus Pacearchaeota archaeon]|tara:strand:+ start:2650 stop:2997 length:348 start_codon:yes stop_codon:yes gene_type:complete